MGALANGFVNLFKDWGRGIGKAVDNYLLDAEARKAISDEVGKKFQPMIDRASRYESKRANNIKDLGDKLNESKDNWQKARNKWQQDYDTALAGAKAQRQTDINDYKSKLQGYNDALDKANAGKQSIVDQLSNREVTYDPYKTLYIDVKTGDLYRLNPISGQKENLSAYYQGLGKKEKRKFDESIQNYEHRLFNKDSDHVINVFDNNDASKYGSYPAFTNYLNTVRAPQDIALRNADNQITRAQSDLTAWQKKSAPTAWDDVNDSKSFKKTYEQTNGKLPNEFSFNGQTYKKEADLNKAYKDALAHEQSRQGIASRTASGYALKRDAEIAQRIQDAKDITKAKLALGAGAGAGALYAGARAMYGGDDTDNTNNIDNTDNTYTGKPDPNFNIENIPEGQALLNGEQSDTAPIDTGFDPDEADALAAAAYDKGVEDGNSVKANDDLGNNIGASTGGHTIDDGLFELLKAMQDPHKANAVADYIYSRYGNDPDVQRLGWRAWLNKYYGDSLRSSMNIDPSGYNGMHVSGGL